MPWIDPGLSVVESTGYDAPEPEPTEDIMKTLAALALPAVFLIAGCSSEKDAVSEEAPRVEAVPAEADIAHAPAAGTEVTLTGSLGCGHCTFGKGEACAVAVQTADGGVYILRGVEESSELFEDRMSGKEIRVVGTLAEGDGAQFLDLKSYEM